MTMPSLLVTVSIIAAATGVAHSLLGEWLIFRHLRRRSLVPSLPSPPLQGRHVRILWATWHLASVFGWVLAWLLWHLARNPGVALPADRLLGATAAGFLTGAVLVLVGTRGRHPGWIALGAVGVLSWAAIGAA